MSAIRDVSRIVRRMPILGEVVRAGDDRRRAQRLAASGVVDPDLYSAQFGLGELTAMEAALHYTTIGFREGATVNALLDPDVLDENLTITFRPIIYDYLNSRAWHVPTATWWDAAACSEAQPECLSHPSGPVGWMWERLRNGDTACLLVDGSPVDPEAWKRMYEIMTDASREWALHYQDRRARIPDTVLEHPVVLPERFPTDAHHPLISVILPVWNRPAQLREAVQSLMNQSWEQWELIVVDDGSWDDTLSVLDVIEQEDPRIRVLRRGHEGVCAARNAGIAAADGDLVAFLDSDNHWMPRFLEDMATTFQAPEVNAAYATITSHTEDGASYRQRQTDHRRLLGGNTIDLNTFVVRTQILRQIGGFDESLRRAVDYDLILRIAARFPLHHVPTVGADYDNVEGADDRISNTEPLGWNIAVRLRHLNALEPVPSATLRKGVSYLISVQSGDPHLDDKLRTCVALGADRDTQVIVTMIEPRVSEWRRARLACAGSATLQPVLLGHEPFSFVVDRVLPRVIHDTAVVIGADMEFSADDLRRLASEVQVDAPRAVMPLLVDANGLLVGLGALQTRPGGLPARVLAGHPPEDARPWETSCSVPLLTGRAFALPTELLRLTGGLDPLLYNAFEAEGLSVSLRSARPEMRFDVLTDVVMRSSLEPPEGTRVDAQGSARVLRALSIGQPGGSPAPYYAPLHQHPRIVSPVDEPPSARRTPHLRISAFREARTTTLDDREVPILRWAIKSAAPAGPRGETWGDTHFARALADALNRLGQDAVVDAREAHHRVSGDLDDVVVLLRGLDEYEPEGAALSYLWVISHPDMVGAREASKFDRVFAASLAWARDTEHRWNLPIEPLLQCTDTGRFHPTGLPRGGDVVFVGNSRGVPRPTVVESVRAGIPIKLFGGDWTDFIPASAVTGNRLDNAALAQVYETASIVLNDHWADMKREGFISNRLFDVIAAGGRVLSDEVPGISEIFGGSVHTFQSVSEIVPLLRGDHDALFASESEVARISERVRTEHSFDARARVLLAAAVTDLGGSR